MSASNRKKAKTTVRTTAIAKRPQPHGGALNVGGTPGNNGGRPASVLRERFRGILEDKLHIVAKIADGKFKAYPSDRLRAVELAAKYSIGEKSELTLVSPEIVARLEHQAQIIASQPNWDSETLLAKLTEDVWR